MFVKMWSNCGAQQMDTNSNTEITCTVHFSPGDGGLKWCLYLFLKDVLITMQIIHNCDTDSSDKRRRKCQVGILSYWIHIKLISTESAVNELYKL